MNSGSLKPLVERLSGKFTGAAGFDILNGDLRIALLRLNRIEFSSGMGNRIPFTHALHSAVKVVFCPGDSDPYLFFTVRNDKRLKPDHPGYLEPLPFQCCRAGGMGHFQKPSSGHNLLVENSVVSDHGFRGPYRFSEYDPLTEAQF